MTAGCDLVDVDFFLWETLHLQLDLLLHTVSCGVGGCVGVGHRPLLERAHVTPIDSSAGMSYALLAGLPAVYGLYSAFVPCVAYAVFGSSPHLAVGPVAVISLLLGHSLHSIFPEAENIDDPNNPGELADVQSNFNEAATQVSRRLACPLL